MKFIFKRIWSFLKTWHEIIAIPLSFLIWFISPYLLRQLDPTAGTYDSGIFQILIFATIAFLFISGVVWTYIKISFPGVFKFIDKLDDDLMTDEDPKNKLTSWQKSIISLSLLAIFFLSMVLLTRVV